MYKCHEGQTFSFFWRNKVDSKASIDITESLCSIMSSKFAMLCRSTLVMLFWTVLSIHGGRIFHGLFIFYSSVGFYSRIWRPCNGSRLWPLKRFAYPLSVWVNVDWNGPWMHGMGYLDDYSIIMHLYSSMTVSNLTIDHACTIVGNLKIRHGSKDIV